MFTSFLVKILYDQIDVRVYWGCYSIGKMPICVIQNFKEESRRPGKVKFYFILIDITSLEMNKFLNTMYLPNTYGAGTPAC